MLLSRVADRVHAVMAGLILVIILIEISFLGSSTTAMAQGHIDLLDWRAFLVAHGAADVAFALLSSGPIPACWQICAGYEA